LFAALRNPNRPPWLVPATLALAFFALDPFNFAIPFLGVVDDLVVLPLLLHALATLASKSSSSMTPHRWSLRPVRRHPQQSAYPYQSAMDGRPGRRSI